MAIDGGRVYRVVEYQKLKSGEQTICLFVRKRLSGRKKPKRELEKGSDDLNHVRGCPGAILKNWQEGQSALVLVCGAAVLRLRRPRIDFTINDHFVINLDRQQITNPIPVLSTSPSRASAFSHGWFLRVAR